MTQEQIAAAAGVSLATLTRATKAARMSTAAADAVRSVPPVDKRTAATVGAAESLKELVADGWTIEQLAAGAGLSNRTVSRVLNGHATPAPRTAAAIARAYEDLRWEDPGESTAAVRSRLRARRANWRPCTPHDDNVADVDPVAVDRAVAGDVVPLTPVEQQLALSRLAGHHPDREIGRRLGVSSRTVLRHRTSQGLSVYVPNRPAEAPGSTQQVGLR